MNACMCCTNNKNKEQVLFICQLWIRKEEVWNNLPQRNSHGQLSMYLRKNSLTSHLVNGRASFWCFTTFNSCNWGLFHVVPNTWILHKSVYQKYGWSGQCLTPFPIAWVDKEYTEMKSPNIHIDLHIYVTGVSTYCGLFIQLPWCHLSEILFLTKVKKKVTWNIILQTMPFNITRIFSMHVSLLLVNV